jgi:ABC-type lipoprotein export system ATPase subunit
VAVSSTAAADLTALVGTSRRPAGARFRLADLQLHTPVDKNFKAGVSIQDAAGRKDFAASYVAAAIEHGVEVMAVTEHNDVSWIDDLRDAASASNVLLFPGFELSSSEGVHVLCLFEPDAEAAWLDDLIVELKLPRNKRRHADGSPTQCKCTLKEIISLVHDRGGICILAHVDSGDGILNVLHGETRIVAWRECGADAIQCSQNPRTMKSGFNRLALMNEADLYQRDRPYACVQTSDARSLAEIGSKASFIKMSSESIEGLRQAFRDPESRVRFPNDHATAPYPRILAMQWDGAFLQAEISVNPNLNCLVGGKGSAKSTIVESIRHLFDLPIRSDTIREQADTLLSEVFPTSAKVSALVEVSKPQVTRYMVERTGREKPIVRSGDSGDIVEGLAPADVLRPVVFGQKEIYETALHLESQLKLLDGYCGDEVTAIQADVRATVQAIHGKSNDIRRLSDEIASDADRVSELPALRERKRLFDQAGLAEKLKEQSDLERERQVFASAAARIADQRRALADARTRVTEIVEVSVPEESPNAELVGNVRAVVGRIAEAWAASLADVEQAIDAAETEVTRLRAQWDERFAKRRSEFDKAVTEVAGEHGEPEIRAFLGLDAKIDELKQVEETVKKRSVRLKTLSGERAESVATLREYRRKIFAVRERWARQLTEQLEGSVRVTVEHQGDRRGALEAIKKLRSGAGTKQLEALVGHGAFSPAALAAARRSGAGALEAQFGLSAATAQQLVRALDAKATDTLETLALEDRVEISLKSGSEFRPLNRLSAGGRSTAILLLALLESEGPLVLDQPEDDLDNAFIYEEVVQRLRTEKERRQFIIATHNANIPVLGDAEQILILKAESDGDVVRAKVDKEGSIDDERIHGPLEAVLEGGREAFQLRKEKYGF